MQSFFQGGGGFFGNFGNFGVLPDPGFPTIDPNDPTMMLPGTPQSLPYADGGGAVCADAIMQLANQGRLNANIGIATNVAQMAASIWGIQQLNDGLASTNNGFFDADIQMLTSSDIMREGPQDANVVPGVTDLQLYPTMTDVAYFSRFPQMAAFTFTANPPLLLHPSSKSRPQRHAEHVRFARE